MYVRLPVVDILTVTQPGRQEEAGSGLERVGPVLLIHPSCVFIASANLTKPPVTLKPQLPLLALGAAFTLNFHLILM